MITSGLAKPVVAEVVYVCVRCVLCAVCWPPPPFPFLFPGLCFFGVFLFFWGGGGVLCFSWFCLECVVVFGVVFSLPLLGWFAVVLWCQFSSLLRTRPPRTLVALTIPLHNLANHQPPLFAEYPTKQLSHPCED